MDYCKEENQPIDEKDSNKNLKFVCCNIQGLVTGKQNKSKFLFENFNESILTLTETWLSDSIFDAEILTFFKNYTLIKSDRKINLEDTESKSKRGGCAILLPDNLTTKCLERFSNGVCELLIVNIINHKTIIAVVYRPPDSSFKKFEEVLHIMNKTFAENENKTKIICGDFNFPPQIVEWYKYDEILYDQITVGHSKGETFEKRESYTKLKEMAHDFYLQQLVDKPTRGNNILDLVYTNDEDLLTNCHVDHRI